MPLMWFCRFLIVPVFLFAISCSVTKQNRELEKQNVLFIAVDELRPELGCYVSRLVQAPRIKPESVLPTTLKPPVIQARP